jgi:hypothetical protein
LANSQALAALLGGGGGGGDESYSPGSDPLAMLQNCLNDLHGLMAAMPDAQHTALIHQAMAPLLKIQSELAQASKPDPRQQLMQQLGGQ